MFDYLKGKITKQLANYIVIDVNGVGYKVYTPNPYKFKENEETMVYVYNHIREDENSLYGFINFTIPFPDSNDNISLLFLPRLLEISFLDISIIFFLLL